MIIFAVATVAIFMFWGMKVYADNAVNVKQGETVEIELDPAAYLSTPLSENLVAKAFKGGVESTEVTVTVTDKEITYEPEHPSTIKTAKATKIKIEVASDAEPGEYELRYNQYNGGGYVWETLTTSGTLTTINVIEVPKDTNDTSTETNPEDAAARQREQEAARQRAKEEAAVKEYWDNLDQGFPSGHTFFSFGGKKLFTGVVEDRIQVYSAGQSIFSVTLKDLYPEAGENAKLFITGKGYHEADGVRYETIKYEIKDGDTVVASGEITLPENLK